MANYSFQTGGADSAFSQADSNSDGRIDLGEFRNFLGGSLGGAGGGYSSSSSYESSSYGAGAGGAGLGAGYSVGYGAGGLDAASYGGASSYESASYSSGAGYGAGFGAGVDAGYAAGGAVDVSGASFGSSSSQVSQYATDAQGLFQDPNPQVIRRPAAGGVQTYTQNIRVRFLQPPPVPPHGPLIIREVRPPQPPPPPPLRIRQQAPPLPTPPPLVLRERPPQPPQVIAGQTVIRRLAALPVPPRSVIIERLPPLPPRPRDVIIERWIPYGAQAKRRTIVQRAGAAVQYAAPRNVIIQYEPVQVRIVRQFQRLGVTQASPQAYLQQYGASLLDAGSLVAQARSAGVVEDISPPHVAAAVGFGASAYGQDVALVGGGGAGFGAAGFGGAAGFEAAGAGAGAGYSSSSFESSSFSSGSGYGAGAGAGYGAGFGASEAAFEAADTNDDGVLSRGEFSNFLGGNAGGAGSSNYQSYSYSSSSY